MTWRDSPLGVVARLLAVFVSAYPLRSVTAVIALLVAGLFEAVGILTLLPLLNLVLEAGTAQGDGVPIFASAASTLERTFGPERSLGVLLVVIVIAMSLKAICVLFAMRHIGYTVAHVATSLRLNLLKALMEAEWRHFLDRPTGYFANAISNEAGRASSAFMASINLVAGAIQVAAYLVSALLVSWQISATALLVGAVLFVLLNSTITTSQQAGRRQTELYRSLVGRLSDGLQGLKALKAMALEDRLEPLLVHETEGLREAQRKQVLSKWLLATMQEPVTVLFLALGLYAALGAWEVPMATVAVLAILFSRTVGRIGSLQKHVQAVMLTESAVWSLNGAIDAAREARERTAGAPIERLESGIRLDGVWFRYGGQTVLRDINLELPAGSITLLSGPSGAGKSTIVDILLGLVDPWRGSVLIDGADLREHDIKSWRRMIGYVPQEIFLFHDTVAKNITLGDPSLGPEQVEAALRIAGAGEFVAALAHGVENVVGERGLKLSGGERQRIALARALVREPRLLVLDEPTTALDPQSEAAICETLQELSGRVTVLVISHQPALERIADQAFELRDGRLIERYVVPRRGIAPV